METTNLVKYLDQFTEMLIDFAPKFATAVAILLIGFWIAKKLTRLASTAMQRSSLNAEITDFLGSLINIALKMLVILVAASLVGIEVTALVGMLAAISFAIGMALQGNLANFAAGISIMVLQPYRIGDWVEISEKFGRVESIQIFYTTIVTPGQKSLIIPNGQVMENIITNFSAKGHIWLELTVQMPYGESFPRVKEILNEAIRSVPNVLQEPAPQIGIEGFDSHSITIGVRPFIHPDNFWEVTLTANESIKNAFSKHNIQVAYSEGIELGKIGQ